MVTATRLRFVLVLVLSIALLAACGTKPPATNSSPGSTGSAPAGSATGEPNLDATLRVILESAPPHLDNQLTTARLGRTVTDPIHVFLVRHDADMNLEPYLAKEWTQPDDVTYRFVINEGVKFHNGRELVAEDIKLSMERALDESVGSQLRADFLDVDTITVVDPYTIEFTLKAPFAPFVDKLARLPIIPMEVVDEQGDMKQRPVGAGPYQFVEWKQDQEIVLERYDDFFMKEEVARNKRLVFRFFPEYTAGVAALERGEADVHLWINVTDLPRLEQNPDIQLLPNHLNNGYYLGFNMDNKPLDDVRFRQAAMLGLDRASILAVAYGGRGTVNMTPLKLDGPWWDDSYAPQEDIDQAKALVQQVGDKTELELLAPNTPIEGPLGQMVQSQLAAIGMNVKLSVLEVPAYLERIGRGDFDMMVIGHAYVDPDDILYRTFISGGAGNYFAYASDEADDLLNRARLTSDQAERRDLYKQLFDVLRSDVPATYMVNETRTGAARANVSGVVLKPNNTYDFHMGEIR